MFSNGWVARRDGPVFIYYASSDTRLHVATSTVDKLVDYVCTRRKTRCLATSAWSSEACVTRKNLEYLDSEQVCEEEVEPRRVFSGTDGHQ